MHLSFPIFPVSPPSQYANQLPFPTPPAQVADVSTSKTGKHGHAKCVFVGIDIFTGKKMEDLTPSSHNCDVPHVTRTDYTLLDVTDDGFVSLMQENGDLKDDLTLPKGTDEAEKLAAQIKADFEAGKELIVSVLSVSPGSKARRAHSVTRACMLGVLRCLDPQ